MSAENSQGSLLMKSKSWLAKKLTLRYSFQKGTFMKSSETKTTEYTINEQCPDSAPIEIKVNILSEGGQIWIQPEGYGEKCAMDDEGWPVGIEIWQGRLRLIIFDDINREDPQIIDLEKSKESHRTHCAF